MRPFNAMRLRKTSSLSGLPAAILADSPWAYYQLNEPSGSTTAADSSPNGRTLTRMGGAAFGFPAVVAGAGTSMRVVKPDSRVLSSAYGASVQGNFKGDKPVSICVLAKMAELGGVLVHVGDFAVSGSQGFFLVHSATGSFGMGAFTSAGWSYVQSPEGALVVGQVAMLHVTRSVGGQVRIYKNGTLVQSGSLLPIIVSSAAGRVSVGTSSESNGPVDPSAGDIQHAAIFNSTLSPERVIAHATAAGFAPL